jgi:hypothetical protein
MGTLRVADNFSLPSLPDLTGGPRDELPTFLVRHEEKSKLHSCRTEKPNQAALYSVQFNPDLTQARARAMELIKMGPLPALSWLLQQKFKADSHLCSKLRPKRRVPLGKLIPPGR